MENFKKIQVHKNTIVPGDVIEVAGKMTTVCANNIKDGNSFIGRSIFGDCYALGHKLVTKFIYISPLKIGVT